MQLQNRLKLLITGCVASTIPTDTETQLGKKALASSFGGFKELTKCSATPEQGLFTIGAGRKGLEDDMAIVERTSLPSELMEEYDKLKALWEERTYIQNVNPQGNFQMEVDASGLVDGTDMAPLMSVQRLTATQSVDANLTASAFGNVAGTVSATRQASPFGGLQLSLRHLLSNQNWIRVSGLVGTRPSVGLDLYHSLSDQMYLTSNNLLSLLPRGFMLSSNASLTRRLGDYTMGTLSITETGSAASARITHKLSPALEASGEVRVGHDSSHVKCSLLYRPEDKWMLKTGLKLGTKGAAFFYGAEQQVATLTTIGGAVLLGSHEGVSLKLRFIRASMMFSIKLHLSQLVSLPAVFYATTLPLLLYGCMKVFAIAPLLRRQRKKELKDKRTAAVREAVEKKREAEAAVELMKETVERILSTEQAKHGLVIIEAWYGHLFDAAGGGEDHCFPLVVDVRVPLQCLVIDSKLVLRDSTKSLVPGFYDPCVGEAKHLRVQYTFRGALHEVTVEDSEPLVIPRRSHREAP